jgi:hypothetical protein
MALLVLLVLIATQHGFVSSFSRTFSIPTVQPFFHSSRTIFLAQALIMAES